MAFASAFEPHAFNVLLSIGLAVAKAPPTASWQSYNTVFVASDFEWFTASRSVAVESYLTRLFKDTSERAKRERKRKRVGAEHLLPRVRRNYAHTCLYMIGPKMLNRNCW